MALFDSDRSRFREIFVSDEHRTLRVILLGIVLAIAVTALTVGLVELLSVDPGWQEVEISQSGVHCGGDFLFQYNYGVGGADAAAERKELQMLYAQCASDAYWMFSPDVVDSNQSNLHTVNHNIGKTVTVHPALYKAFEQMEASGCRDHYLGPVYVVYKNLAFSQGDDAAAAWDPNRNEEQAQYVAQLAAFARDEQTVNLALLGNNQVQLQVSEEYLQFAEANEIENYVDFGWMKNAFIIDYFAETIAEKGYTQGYFVSQDGFTRNLSAGVQFRMNLFDRENGTVYVAASMPYEGPLSAVALRNYPNSMQSAWDYYAYTDGTITTSFVDIGDGLSRSATSDLLCYSKEVGCAQLLLQMLPVYISDQLDTNALTQLAVKGVFSIWGEGDTLRYTDPDAKLEALMVTEEIAYKAEFFS